MEVWLDHPVYKLEVSNLGSVRGAKGGVRKLRKDHSGYLRLNIKHKGRFLTLQAHRLVADIWCGPRAEGQSVDHIDGDKANNAASNLQILSAAENTTKAFRQGLVGTCKPISVDGQTFYSLREAERVTGIARHTLAAA